MKKKVITEVIMGAPLDRMPSRINHGFGEKRSYEVHPGVDLSTPSGTPVKAPMDGEVVNVNNNGHLCGGTIDIDYKNGFWSRFCHIKRIDVTKGQVVSAGQVVGLSGGDRNDPQRGNSKGAHLHFTLKKDGKLVDPMLYINKFDVGTSDFPMSGATPSMDKSGWDEFFSKDGISSAAAKAPKLDPLLKSILSPLEKALNLKTENVEFIKTLSESLSLENGILKGKNIFSVKTGMNMLSPEDGKVVNISDSKECSRGIFMKHSVDNMDYYSKFCNVKPKVVQGESIPKGRTVGIANENATIQIFDKKQKALNLKNFVKSDNSSDSENLSKNKKQTKKIQSMDPLLQAALTPLRLLNLPDLDLKSTTSSGTTEPFKAVKWLKSNSLTKNESVERNINQIKKLL